MKQSVLRWKEDEQRWFYVCFIPDPDRPGVLHYFETTSTDADGFAAIAAAMREVEERFGRPLPP
jgi:hypothetical protein